MNLPLFPLQTVLFPGMPIHLHIFEKRYRLMIQRCLQKDLTFGVVLLRKGHENEKEDHTYSIGCTAKIVDIETLKDGRFYLTALGESRFRIHSIDTRIPYMMGNIEELLTDYNHSHLLLPETNILRRHIRTYLELLSATDGYQYELKELSNTNLHLPEEPIFLIHLAASLLQLPSNEKQNLLSISNLFELNSQIQRIFRREISIMKSLAEMDREAVNRSMWQN
ncbi:MAG: LON peptidase substrate-binding domain-containing protein [Anaerolineaceae bacterium]|nr:LON peptidase substrate-binding domain-containing protein [Anaerolineaceae bacterium]